MQRPRQIKKLLSLPECLVYRFHELRSVDREEWFCASDPPNTRLGSGGGTAWLLEKAMEHYAPGSSMASWLAQEKRMVIHAGGESRRLPAYAPSGKILMPLPGGSDGQRDLLSLQTPLCENILNKAPCEMHTLVASGDVYVSLDRELPPIPPADVVCFGVSANPEVCSRHGVFVFRKNMPGELDRMLQKPSAKTLDGFAGTHGFLIDAGIWLFSDRAVEVLMKRSGTSYYNLYSDFGRGLGSNPGVIDRELNELSVRVVCLGGGVFHHFGTSSEMVHSVLDLTDRPDRRRYVVQNSDVRIPLTPANRDVWIENSYIGPQWRINSNHIITGIPCNDWAIHLPERVCADVIPIGGSSYIARPYGFTDTFTGDPRDATTTFMGKPLMQWLEERELKIEAIRKVDAEDIQLAELFPECRTTDELGLVLRWMISEPELAMGKVLWEKSRKFSANQIIYCANPERLFRQRHEFSRRQPQRENTTLEMLQKTVLAPWSDRKQNPSYDLQPSRTVEGLCPARIDLAGGWTDTPPYCLDYGGSVVNMAIELNGEPPLQVCVSHSDRCRITLRSANSGETEIVSTYDELENFTRIGSRFSIPKAALAMAGFSPHFSLLTYDSLEKQLQALGGGMEITLHSAIPVGSGLGSSSILAATVLASLSDFCGLSWAPDEICAKTLALEQLITAGGGWQDQFGGVIPGVKLLVTKPGTEQLPVVKRLPDGLFTNPDNKPCHLLYYTGITRTAKYILSGIVQRMLLKEPAQLRLLAEMKEHASNMAEAIRHGNPEQFGALLNKSWEQNKMLDPGTAPPEVEKIIRRVSRYVSGCKLPGAGGGGYLYMVAKDADAARKIKEELTLSPPNSHAKFVEMSLSVAGLQILHT